MTKKIFPVFLILSILTCPFLLAENDSLRKIDTDMTVSDQSTDTVFSERINDVFILTIDGAIGTVTTDRVLEAVDKAEEESADLLLILMDTPGGFNDSFWPITKALMNSRVPVAVYVYPAGARAASAGVYITYAAHIAAMAPGTNIGAAHVVSGTGEQIDSVLNEKIMNDAVAALKAMAERTGRNAEYAEKMARESISLTNTEALDHNVIDFVAKDIDDLLEKIDGMEINTVHGKKTVHTENPRRTELKETLIQSFLNIITSPNVVFILFSLGGLGLVLELYNPGAILPGVVGGICIILAFYGFRTLPINYAGLLLIVFSLILFILEIKIVSHGLLTIGGVISMIIGGLMLIDTADPDLRISMSVIIIVALFIGALVALAFTLAFKARIARPTTGKEGLLGEIGTVKERIDPTGYIYVAGELWKASADGPLEVGDEVEVIEVDNIKIKVKKKTR